MKIKLQYSTDMFAELLKGLLSLKQDGSYRVVTIDQEFELQFLGDKEEVRRRIFEWLQRRLGEEK